MVGAGLSGAVIAERYARLLDKKVLVMDRRPHSAGNCYDYLDRPTGTRPLVVPRALRALGEGRTARKGREVGLVQIAGQKGGSKGPTLLLTGLVTAC